jgi:signal transduction histidine kinase
MNQAEDRTQAAGTADFPADIGGTVRQLGAVALCCLATAGFTYMAVGVELLQGLASWLVRAWSTETLGVLLPAVVAMATWMAPNRGWASESDAAKPPPGDARVPDQAALRDRLGRGVVEASERRQQHLSQSLEVGLVRQLAGVSVLARLLEKRLSAEDRPEALEVAKLRELVERTISEARLLAAAAHPPEIETEGLEAALRKMAGAAEPHRVYCRVVQESCCPPADSASALQLYRVVQVLVERAIRHGVAHHILVEMTAGPEKYMSLTVTDRVGHGDHLPPLTASELSELQARVRSIGGSLQVEQPAAALRLTCRLLAKGPKLQV